MLKILQVNNEICMFYTDRICGWAYLVTAMYLHIFWHYFSVALFPIVITVFICRTYILHTLLYVHFMWFIYKAYFHLFIHSLIHLENVAVCSSFPCTFNASDGARVNPSSFFNNITNHKVVAALAVCRGSFQFAQKCCQRGSNLGWLELQNQYSVWP